MMFSAVFSCCVLCLFYSSPFFGCCCSAFHFFFFAIMDGLRPQYTRQCTRSTLPFLVLLDIVSGDDGDRGVCVCGGREGGVIALLLQHDRVRFSVRRCHSRWNLSGGDTYLLYINTNNTV